MTQRTTALVGLMLVLLLLTTGCFFYEPADDHHVMAQGETLNVSAALGVKSNDLDKCLNGGTIRLHTPPSHGTVNLAANGSFTYTPNAAFSGQDYFTYFPEDKVTGFLVSLLSCQVEKSGYVSITVEEGTPAFSVANNSYTTVQDTALTVSSVRDNDVFRTSSPTSSLQAGSGPTYGSLTGNALTSTGGFTYTPNAGFLGTDSFVVETGGSTSTVTIRVILSGTPKAVDDTFTIVYSNSVTIPAPGVLANDPAGLIGTSSASKISDPAKGTVTLNSNGSFTYTANSGATGTDTFVYKRLDSVGASSTGTTVAERDIATVTINIPTSPVITANPDLYFALAGSTSTVASTTTGVLFNDADPAFGTLSATLVRNVSKGTLSLSSNGGFTYKPNVNATGTDTFDYSVTNGSSTSATTTVTILIQTNPVPQASADRFDFASYTISGSTLSVASTTGVLSNDHDSYRRALTATLVSQASNGTVALSSDGSFTYTPNSGFFGNDSFTYKASNGKQKSATTTATIITYQNNQAPITSVPGLSSVALVGLGIGLMIVFFWTYRRRARRAPV